MAAQPTELTARLIDLFGSPATADPTKLYGNLTVNPNGTVTVGTGLTMPDGYTSANTPAGRNRIINGDCRIAQRSSIAVTSSNGGYGGPDRFLCAVNSAGQFTQSLGSITYGGVTRPAVVQTVNTINTNFTTSLFWSGIVQRIEGNHCFDMLGQSVVISFIFSTNVTGTYSVSLEDSTQVNSYVSTFAATAGVPIKVIIPISTLPTNLVVPQSNALGMIIWIGSINAGTYATSSLNSWKSTNSICSTTSTNWAATANNFIAVTELQFETGTYATPFERIDMSRLLMQCQRYYQTDQPIILPSRADFHSPIMLKVPMRTTPTIVWYSAATLNVGYIRDNDNARDVQVTGSGGGPNWIYPVTGGSPSMAVNSNTTVGYRLTAEL
jgi:hypothetical protein